MKDSSWICARTSSLPQPSLETSHLADILGSWTVALQVGSAALPSVCGLSSSRLYSPSLAPLFSRGPLYLHIQKHICVKKNMSHSLHFKCIVVPFQWPVVFSKEPGNRNTSEERERASESNFHSSPWGEQFKNGFILFKFNVSTFQYWRYTFA